MLWQIGVIVLLVDVFYRVSVPIDHLFQYKETRNSTTTKDGNREMQTKEIANDKETPNSIVIDDKGVALLLDRLQLAFGDGGKKSLLHSLQKQLFPTPSNRKSKSSNDNEKDDEVSNHLQSKINTKESNHQNTPHDKKASSSSPAAAAVAPQAPHTHTAGPSPTPSLPRPTLPKLTANSNSITTAKKDNFVQDPSASAAGEGLYQGKEEGPRGAKEFFDD